MDREASRWGLALLVVFTLAVRISAVCYNFDQFGKDTDDYGRLATQLVKSGTYGYPIEDGTGSVRPTAYRPPLYPGLLCATVLNGEIDKRLVAAIHVVLGLLTVLCVYYIGWRMSLKHPWIPALAVAADPILLNQSRELMTETPVTLLSVWAWALYLILIRPTLAELGQTVWGMRFWLRSSLLLGLALGLACLTRPTMLPWAALVIASLAMRSSEAGNRVSMISATMLVVAILNVGWMVRNKRELGEPVLTTTHGGYTLLLANNPVVYDHFQKNGPSRNWDEDEFHRLWARRHQGGDPTESAFWNVKAETETTSVAKTKPRSNQPELDEVDDDRLASKAAIATIKSDYGTFALSCLYRAGWFWSVYPNLKSTGDDKLPGLNVSKSLAAQWLIGAWYSLWFFMAILGLLRLADVLSSRQWMVPLLLVITLTAIHAIYFSNMRFRAPVMPVVYVIACWPLLRVRTISRFAT